jgi:hypothetical protein
VTLPTADEQAHLRDPSLLAEWFDILKRTIAVDFDGTIHPYTDGWVGSIPADEPPIDGVREFLIDLDARGFRTVVFSCRADHIEGKAGIADWLLRYDLLPLVAEITHVKPAAVAYVDDRAVVYSGDWPTVMHHVLGLADGRAHAADPAPGPVALDVLENGDST